MNPNKDGVAADAVTTPPSWFALHYTKPATEIWRKNNTTTNSEVMGLCEANTTTNSEVMGIREAKIVIS